MKTRSRSISRYLQRWLTLSSFVLISVIIVVITKNYYSTVNELKGQYMESSLESASEQLNAQLQIMITKAQSVAANDIVRRKESKFTEVKEILNRYVDELQVNSIGFVTKDGYLTSTDGFENDISERDYFKQIMQGETYINKPTYNTASQKYIIFVGCPIYSEGEIIGAITVTFDSDYLSDLVVNLSDNEDIKSFMIDQEGTVIAHQEVEKVESGYNIINVAKEDEAFQSSALAYESILNSTSGKIDYKDENGKKQTVYYHDVDGQEGWKLISQIERRTFYQEVYAMINIQVILLIIGCTYAAVTCYFLGKRIGKRVQMLGSNLKEMAQGNFTFEVKDASGYQDEVTQAYQAMELTVHNIHEILAVVKHLASNMEENGATLENTADHMKTGTETIANSIYEISVGNGEQSEEICRIYEQMEQFKQSMVEVFDHMKQINQIAEVTDESLENGKDNMKQLNAVFEMHIKKYSEYNRIIQRMNESIEEISMITGSIQQIAGQTNLLALNAAIEAARVGEAGKGFSVVAEEIRKLSEQSEVSVKEINEVINKVCEEGEQLYSTSREMNEQLVVQKSSILNTVTSFQELSDDIEKMVPMIEQVFKLNQTAMQGVDSISQSIENTNAISEELAATSEQVAMTGKHFQESSNEVSEISSVILTLTAELTEQLKQFTIRE